MRWPWTKDRFTPYQATLPGNDEPVLDPNSPTWKFLCAKLAEDLEVVRVMNDDRKYGPEETAYLRGRIRAIKDVLTMDKAK